MSLTKTKGKTKPKTAELTEAELLAARDALLEIKSEQDKLREKELAIRAYLADLYHTGEEGSKTVEIHGHKLTITRSINRSITKEEVARFQAEHGDLALEVLTFRPEIKVGPYKEHADIVDDYITSKPGPPTVVFKS